MRSYYFPLFFNLTLSFCFLYDFLSIPRIISNFNCIIASANSFIAFKTTVALLIFLNHYFGYTSYSDLLWLVLFICIINIALSITENTQSNLLRCNYNNESSCDRQRQGLICCDSDIDYTTEQILTQVGTVIKCNQNFVIISLDSRGIWYCAFNNFQTVFHKAPYGSITAVINEYGLI